MRKLILASASPRRRELLEKAGISFSVMPAKGEEKTEACFPDDIVTDLSRAKAFAVSQGEFAEGTLILGADTIVYFEGRILGKPRDQEDAVRTLSALQGQTHQVYTGVTVLEKKGEGWIPHSFAECTDVTFYPLTQEEIRRYVEGGEPMDKAGSYGIQGEFSAYVKCIYGDYFNVVGLPVARLVQEMKKLGIDLRECVK